MKTAQTQATTQANAARASAWMVGERKQGAWPSMFYAVRTLATGVHEFWSAEFCDRSDADSLVAELNAVVATA